MAKKLELTYEETNELVRKLKKYPLEKWRYSEKREYPGDCWVSHTRTYHNYSLKESSKQIKVTDKEDDVSTLGFGSERSDISHEYTLSIISANERIEGDSYSATTLFEYLNNNRKKREEQIEKNEKDKRNDLVKKVLETI